MKNQKEFLNQFQVEELEKRFEMGWIDKAEVEINTGNHNCPDSSSSVYSGGGGGDNSQHME